jgi:hypothetical protein
MSIFRRLAVPLMQLCRANDSFTLASRTVTATEKK